MQSGVRKLFWRKSGKKVSSQAEAVENGDDVVDDPFHDDALGLEVWVEGENPIVEYALIASRIHPIARLYKELQLTIDHDDFSIVAIHGLNGHREKTWTAKNNVNWLRDSSMLPEVIGNARIMSWGFDANTHSTKQLSVMYLYDHGRKLVSDLSLHRRLDKTDKRPIIFVAHSLGGIVLKSALIHSNSTGSNHLHYHKSIKTSTYGIIFMGTPHQGGERVAWGKRLVNVASIFVKTNDRLLNILEKDSETLQQQLGQYASISSDFETKFAFETRSTSLAVGPAIIVVPKSSAVVPGHVDAEPIAIMDDHINMVKFPSPKSNGFKTVAGHLKLMAENAPAKVEKNWQTEGIIEAASVVNLKQNFDIMFDFTSIPKTNNFMGRKAELALLKQQLMPDEALDDRKISVVHGLGGMGKTQLAIQFARLHKASYSSSFWLDGKTEVSLVRSLVLLASRLPPGQIKDVDARDVKGLEESRERAQEVLQWFALKGNTRWLLIYDNIDKTSYKEDASDLNTEPLSTYDITQYLPKGDGGSIIITTRLQRLVPLGSQLPLSRLDVIDSLLILEQHAGRSLKRAGSNISSGVSCETDEWDPDAILLVERLGRLPLAVVFAGSYLSKTSIVKYLEFYDKSWKHLHETMKNQHDYPERTIISTWQISYDELKHEDEGAAKLLRLWGYLDNQEIWFQLLQWKGFESDAPSWLRKITATEISFLTVAGTLLNYSLIERNDNNTYSMHVVVHDWIRASINEKDDEGLFQIATTTIGLAVPETNQRDSWIIQRQLLPHVSRWSQYWNSGNEIKNIVNQEAYLSALNNLGVMYRNYSRLAEAEAMYAQALAGKEKTLGAEHISTLDTVNNLGVLYWNQGRLAEAEAIYTRALAGREKALGAEHISTLDTVNNLGVLYWNQGRLAEAEAMYAQALAGKEKTLGAEHLSTLDTVNNLGVLYKDQGQLAEAEAMYTRALAGREKALGAKHASTLQAAKTLFTLYTKQDRNLEADAIHQRYLERSIVLEPSPPP